MVFVGHVVRYGLAFCPSARDSFNIGMCDRGDIVSVATHSEARCGQPCGSLVDCGVVCSAYIHFGFVYDGRPGVGERDGRIGHSRVRVDNDDIRGGCVFVLCYYIEWARLGAAYSFDVHLLLGFGPVYVCSVADGRVIVRDNGSFGGDGSIACVRKYRVRC